MRPGLRFHDNVVTNVRAQSCNGFAHSNGDVRDAARELTVALYALIGDEVRLAPRRGVRLSERRLPTEPLLVWRMMLLLRVGVGRSNSDPSLLWTPSGVERFLFHLKRVA